MIYKKIPSLILKLSPPLIISAYSKPRIFFVYFYLMDYSDLILFFSDLIIVQNFLLKMREVISEFIHDLI
jgi:hypothetical protein